MRAARGLPTRYAVGVLALTLMTLVLAGCSGKPQAASTTAPHNVTLTKEQQKSIHVVTIAPTAYRTTITTTGIVDFDRNHATDILAPFSGAVTRVAVTQGQKVTKGQALAYVASSDFAAAAGAYRQTVLAASAADAVAANDRALFAKQAISQRDNAQAQADAATADANRAAALQALVALHMDPAQIAAIREGHSATDGQGVIRAPIAGTVVVKSIAPGQTLAAGTTPCFTVANTATMWVMANVFGDDVTRVAAGDTATIDTGDGGQSLAGTVTNVGAVVESDTRAVAARVRVANAAGILKKQMYVSVHIHSQAQRNGLLVPVSSVLRNSQDLPFVYVVQADGSYARNPITLGPRVGDRFVVSGGLHAGDKVVANGAIFLHFIQTQ